ncbi:ATP-binding protein [Streptomyces sp. cmx-4-9]|uniref:ATP-binding protein n=1 Tax=Streptomyces sp. cmx-4-9 TaxID=2790941 RepID=UPI00397F08F6
MSPQMIEISLPRTLEAPGHARRALNTCVRDRELADEGALLLSEAVANAVEHTESERLRLVIRHDAETGALMCAVRDGNAELSRPEPRTGAPGRDAAGTEDAEDAEDALDESGRGLGIIAALSAAWGVSTDGFGKWLWFRLDGPASAGCPGWAGAAGR